MTRLTLLIRATLFQSCILSLGAPPGTQYVSRNALFGEQIEEIDDDIVDERRQKLNKLVHVNIKDDGNIEPSSF